MFSERVLPAADRSRRLRVQPGELRQGEAARGLGPAAEHRASRLPQMFSAALADPADSANALAEAAQRRRRSGGIRCTGPLLDEPPALDALQAQDYGNLEILVVNDGGQPVDEVVTRYPRARLIANERNVGVFATLNNGIVCARGRYIGLLADDDIDFPDHVRRLVTALEQSSAKVAHANALTRFLASAEDGSLWTTGHQVLFAGHLDTTEILWGGAQTTQALLVHRDVFDEVGCFDTTLAQADYDFLIRLSRRYDFVHVDHVTCECRYRTDGTTMSHTAGLAPIIDGLTTIFARYGSGGNGYVDRSRSETLAYVRDHHGSQYWEPALPLQLQP
jgi:hypothetical protein